MRTSRHEQARFGWLRPSAMAREIGMSEETVREWIRSGELKGYDFGSEKRPEYRVEPDVWRAFKEARAVVPRPADPGDEDDQENGAAA